MATLNVGTGEEYTTIAAAAAAAQDGDTVLVQAGTYTNDFVHVATRITLEAVGGMVNMVATVAPPNGKAILDTYADTTVIGFSFSGAAVRDNNGAGIRSNAGDLTVRDSVFFNNQDGILATGSNDVITITGSEFSHNGAGDGYSHNIYVNKAKSLVIDNSYFHDSVVGHEIKSRALSTTITNTRIMDNAGGSGSYSVDLPNGGVATLQNNVIEKGPNTENQAILHFGGEGPPYAGSSLTVTGNTIVNDRATVTGLNNQAGAPVTFTGNTLYGITQDNFGVQSGNTVVATRPVLDLTTRAVIPALPTPVPAPAPVVTDTPAGLSYVDYGREGAVVASGHVLQVGAGRAFTTLQSALDASVDGDTVEVDAGTYTDDFATATHKVIIEGVGGMANFVADRIADNDVGILDVQNSVTVRNLSFSGARSYEGNGAGIRVRGGDVTVTNSVFTGNDVAILAHAPAQSLGIYDTEIAANGNYAKGTHNLNIGDIGSFTLVDSYVHDGLVAHEVNDRAFYSRIEQNRIIDGPNSNASFGINLGRGGVATIKGNMIEKGANSANGLLVHVGGEGPTYSKTDVQVLDNTLVSDYVGGWHPYTYFVVSDPTSATDGKAPAVTVDGNTFVGGVPGSEQAANAVSQNATIGFNPVLSTAKPWVAPVGALPATQGGPDTLRLTFNTASAEAAAQVLVSIDGVAVGGGIVTNGDLTYSGTWGGGTHTVTVHEINTHYGTSLTGGKTQLTALTLDGVAVTPDANELTWQDATVVVDTPYQAHSAALAAADPLAGSPLFDAGYYLAHNPDVAAAGIDPLTHFEKWGWAEGRDPSAAFSEAKYLSANPDVAAAHINPLLHYIQWGQAEGRSAFAVTPPKPTEASMFDATYYLAHNPDVAAAGIDPLTHFEKWGWSEVRDPSASFSDSRYLEAYADVKAANIDPLMHYAQWGQNEGRMTFAVQTPVTGPATEAQLFDAAYYLGHNADVRAAHIDPLLHYEQYGWMEGRDPSAGFSTTHYLAANPDVAAAHIDPLGHYAQWGQAEGRLAYAV